MLRGEVFLLSLLGLICVIVGLTWLFGPLALFGAALVLGAFALFVNMKE